MTLHLYVYYIMLLADCWLSFIFFIVFFFFVICFFQAEDGIRDLVRSRGLGDVYKRQVYDRDIGQAAHCLCLQAAADKDRGQTQAVQIHLHVDSKKMVEE